MATSVLQELSFVAANMKADHKRNLQAHVANIASSLIQQVTPTGEILARDPGGAVSPHLPAMHHLVELLCALNPALFSYYNDTILGWMLNPKSDVLYSQFCIDTFARLRPGSDDVARLIEERILPSQLADGQFTCYTAFLHGGDFFSTLWCVKTLLRVDHPMFAQPLRAAVAFLDRTSRDSRLSANQLGFYYFLRRAAPADLPVPPELKAIRTRLVEAVKGYKFSSETLLWHIYLIEDILSDPADSEARVIAEAAVSELFALATKAKELPKLLHEYGGAAPQGEFYHVLAKACAVGLRLLGPDEVESCAVSLTEMLLSRGQKALYTAVALDRDLKIYLRFQKQHEMFVSHEKLLEAIWSKTPFEKTVFVMMPFRKEKRYQRVLEAIRGACSRRGYFAIRTDDDDRSFLPNLWGNMLINMLSSCQGIAVHMRESKSPLPQRERRAAKKRGVFASANANVALELGFFLSRGQRVLLLRERKAPLHADIADLLRHEFDERDPEAEVKKAVNRFLNQIEKSREAPKPKPE